MHPGYIDAYSDPVHATKDTVAAVAGWFTTGESPHLIGSRCSSCGVVAFPPRSTCPNPGCSAADLHAAPLGRRGRVWSYTDAQYQPPSPYISPTDTYRPFALAAVLLDEDQLIVLGQLVDGCTVDDLYVGQPVELVVEPLFETDDSVHLMWRWSPVEEEPADA